MNVPFNDLYAQYLSLKDEIDDAIAQTIRTSSFVRGPEVEFFEEQFAKLNGVKHCVSCANGTDALYIALHTLGVKSGDEVIVPAHSWISTSETVTQAGGNVIFCDTRDNDFTIDTAAIEEKITQKTVGIIPVHLFGHPAQMDEVMQIAKKYNLWVIEDCAQAHLATFAGSRVGTFGDVATFSFYPGKNLGAMGDAGALVTGNAQFAHRAACFARHGGVVKGIHKMEGINSRLDGLQAAILNVKMPRLMEWTQKRQNIANTYKAKLNGIGDLILPQSDARASHVWHLFVVRSKQRDALKQHLAENGVQTVINYPIALPFLEAYAHQQNSSDDFPIASLHQGQILSLPVFPEMSPTQVEKVVYHIDEFFTQ